MAAGGGRMGCWRGPDGLLEGVGWAAGGGQMGCWRGSDSTNSCGGVRLGGWVGREDRLSVIRRRDQATVAK
eukprot:1181995-Prorocentrum_minimum.AAC.2